jgi:hypothetical protein
LSDFAKISVDSDKKAVESVQNGAIVVIIAVFLNLFCSISSSISYILILFYISLYITPILIIAGYGLMIFGYLKLTNSETFPTKAKAGAQILYIATILATVATILTTIDTVIMINSDFAMFSRNPYLYFPAAILTIISSSLVLWGWVKIKNVKPVVSNE